MNPSRVFLVSLSLFVGAAAGCGPSRPDRVPVSGKVMIDDQPLKTGYITVMPTDARPAYAEIRPDGSFTLSTFEDNDGCVLGSHKVLITSREVLNGSSQKWWAPKEYSDPSSSELVLTVTEPTDSAVITLTWNGKKPFVESFGGNELGEE